MHLRQRVVVNYIRTKFKLLSTISKKKAAVKAFKLFCTPQHRNRKKLPPVFEKAERLNFTFEGLRIQGYRWNHPMSKKVLIVHGFESSVVNFDRYVKPLIKAGYEVLAFDAPAHGRSSGKTIDVIAYKNFIYNINENFGPIQSFIAHSFGGLALSLSLEEMSHDKSFKVVLIAAAAETTTAVNTFFNFLKLNDGVRKEFEALIETVSGHPSTWFSIARIAPTLKANVLWLQDKDDEMTPLSDVSPIMEMLYPNFEFFITEGLGHRRIYRDNKVSKKIIAFLSDDNERINL
jgi:pimeloyl-ACP methyl ester carboxylesterase